MHLAAGPRRSARGEKEIWKEGRSIRGEWGTIDLGAVGGSISSKDGDCLGYFSIAVIKHHDQGNLKKEECIWVSQSQRDKSPSQLGGMAASGKHDG